jgi:dUTP pyrophosphatase
MGLFGKRRRLPELTWHVPEGTEDFLIPTRATEGSLAYDLISPTSVTLNGAQAVIVNTLVAVTLPPGYGLILGSRSGLAVKHITVEAGWIDSDYRGMIKVVLYNHGRQSYKVKAGERIAQARLVEICEAEENVEYEYPDPGETARGAGGFGSTGK